MRIIPVYCPECAKEGRKKILMKVDDKASGLLLPWCKIHGNVKVVLPLEVPKCH